MGGEFFDDQENLREPGENPPYHASEIYRADARDVLGKLTSEGLSYSMPELQKQAKVSRLHSFGLTMWLQECYLAALGDPYLKTIPEVGVPQACEHYATEFAAFLRTGEDFVGDLFVPKIGLAEVHTFKQAGEVQQLLEVVQEDVRRLLERPDWVGKGSEHVDAVLAVADPSGEDDPLVWISPGFEEQTGYQRKWVLGRNCRFLQPKDHHRNEQFNGDQLNKLRQFCQDARKSRRPTHTHTFALLLNERRNSSAFWNLSSFLHVEVNGKPFIVSVMLPFREEKVRLAELMSLDPQALAQQKRLRSLLARHEGGAKFTSLQAVVRQLYSVFFDDFPRVLQAPSLPAPSGPVTAMPIFGLEVGANNAQAMAASLKAGLRHVHIVLPSGPTTKATDGSAFVRKILPLKLAMSAIRSKN
ncbi:pfyP [Symbiodinium natans]|uniref:PfyP protein n=1 Tax=Symbiodinium natans TaxID=878477 RepID=A0A812LLZ2_9DINO|nr:pfyP [Symbiodinium natans]